MNPFYELKPRYCRYRWWMWRVCYIARIDRDLYAAFGLHWLLMAAFWIQHKWAVKANARPSMIEKLIRKEGA